MAEKGGRLKISILCPSRGRPDRFAAMMWSALEMADVAERVEVLLAVDVDDKTINQYPEPDHVQQFRTPAGNLVNALAHKASGDILMAAADDVLFRTKGWDTKVREVAARYPDGLYIASPMNGDGRRRVNHWFTGRQWLNLFGWIVPEHFEHFSGDEWVQEVASPCGRLVYMDDVLIEHMHKKYGKAPNDEGYRSKRERAPDGSCMSDRDIARFKALAPQREADKATLRRCVST